MKSWVGLAGTFSAFIAAGTCLAACRSDAAPRTTESSSAVLRVGVGQVSSTSPTSGLRQLTPLVSVEGLARLASDGRVQPWFAESWKLTNGGRSLMVTIKPGATFHDGSPADASHVVDLLPAPLKSALGPLYDDVEQISAGDANTFEIRFRRPSPFLLESLEVQIKKPGQAIVATGPYMGTASPTEFKANDHYYLGKPQIDNIHIQTFPSVRTAWAELLRDRIDMLWDVSPDALDSLQSATNVAVFTYVRHYQYSLVLNQEIPALRSIDTRRALNEAVDRKQLVHAALADHGVPSTGPIWPKHWALPTNVVSPTFDPAKAEKVLQAKRLKFTCLVPPDQVYERIAIELKRQLAAVGVEMDVRATSQDEIYAAEDKHAFEAILIETIGGPTLLRTYMFWHSKGPINPGRFGNKTVDAAFDPVRYAETDAQYRDAAAGLQQAFIDDPPAIFLAWSERARAISRRFQVPPAEAGRDIMITLPLWKPRNDNRLANRN
jgi:peptide/nickel transport system substrate-binding protein